MKRLLVSVAAVAVAAAWALPGVSDAQTGAQDSVTGTARDCTTPVSCPTDPSEPSLFTTLTADALSGPAGENSSGTMTWGNREVGLLIRSETQVSCLSVTDNVAIVGVGGRRAFSGIFGTISVSIAGLIRVTDGGGPDSGLDTFEFAVLQNPFPPFPPQPPPLPAPTDCSAFPAGTGVLTNEEGDLVVHDAPPLPTSKDQCRNGGWRNYETSFKNQGQCVAFVEHGRQG